MKLTQAELAQKIGSINLGEELKKAIEYESNPTHKPSQVINQDYHKMELVTRDILASLERHEVNPVQAYMITGAFSDAVYAMLVEASLENPKTT